MELATNAQRDTFAETPLDVIKSCCDKLGTLADKLIQVKNFNHRKLGNNRNSQEFTDSLILQPASLDVATVRKRADEELGIVVESPQPGIHLVTEVGTFECWLLLKDYHSQVRMLNPSARLEAGDEIVQVNYQTVVGWQNKKVLQLMAENPVELILTLKKRPRHSNLGQIYMKPFRIPTRKKSGYYINNLPSPRTELLVVPDVSLPIVQRHQRHPSDSSSDLPLSDTEDDEDSEDDEAFLPVAAAEVAGQIQIIIIIIITSSSGGRPDPAAVNGLPHCLPQICTLQVFKHTYKATQLPGCAASFFLFLLHCIPTVL